ncbi:MAG: 4-(cytidine 5'-diphospho)-2-C-methyl-D-erythritol kinase [Candidatus Zixiibacteriota bacterium]
MPDRCRVLAPAKINLGLTVRFRRDDGFHELETVMVALDLYDELEFERTRTGGIRLDLVETDRDEQDRSAFPLDETNLIVRAIRALEHEAGVVANLHIKIKKRIPIAAGLGGGSSNAAAALAALVKLYELDIGMPRLSRIAGGIGSDVPFFLNGPAARATGRGEIIQPISLYSDWWVMLIAPPIHLSTADVYRQLNLTSHPTKNSFSLCGDEKGFYAGLQKCRNDLEEIATGRYPELSEYMRHLRKAGAEGTFVTGSGPTVVGVFRKHPDNDTVRNLQTRLEQTRVLIAKPVRTVTALVVQ